MLSLNNGIVQVTVAPDEWKTGICYLQKSLFDRKTSCLSNIASWLAKQNDVILESRYAI